MLKWIKLAKMTLWFKNNIKINSHQSIFHYWKKYDSCKSIYIWVLYTYTHIHVYTCNIYINYYGYFFKGKM